MKKVICIFVCILIMLGIFSNSSYAKGSSLAGGIFKQSSEGGDIQKSIAKKIIRFHVIANSDTDEDQALKLKVRDKVLEYITPKLKNSKSIDESRKILQQNNAEINKIACNIVKNNGYKYNVKTELSQENFPVKSYGNITLPPGSYEAYRIIIGSGEGHNWWCVMFPPLCFIDLSKGQVANEQTEKEMKNVLTSEEYAAVDNPSDNNQIQVKFKIVEIIKSLLKNK